MPRLLTYPGSAADRVATPTSTEMANTKRTPAVLRILGLLLSSDIFRRESVTRRFDASFRHDGGGRGWWAAGERSRRRPRKCRKDHQRPHSRPPRPKAGPEMRCYGNLTGRRSRGHTKRLWYLRDPPRYPLRHGDTLHVQASNQLPRRVHHLAPLRGDLPARDTRVSRRGGPG